ncbi:MAG TPA: hypothetical protein VGB68_05780 [Pyrinomonadaceae bacterium]|jgi:hypothetical protein
MTEEKKNSKKRQTKAGMSAKNNKQTATGKDKTGSEKKPENTPKMSKEKAEKRGSDKPLH